MTTGRQGFGIDALDRLLGGGLLPGTLTVVAGATGAGKTQLGLRWADAGTCRGGASRGDLRPDEPRRRPEPRAVCAGALRVGPVELPERRPPRPGLGLGFRAADRRLFPPLRPRRPSRDAPRPRARRLARLEDRPGARARGPRSASSTRTSSGGRAGSSSTGSSRPSGSPTRSSSSSSSISITRSSARRTSGRRASSSASDSAPTAPRSRHIATTTGPSAASTSTRPPTSCSTT